MVKDKMAKDLKKRGIILAVLLIVLTAAVVILIQRNEAKTEPRFEILSKAVKGDHIELQLNIHGTEKAQKFDIVVEYTKEVPTDDHFGTKWNRVSEDAFDLFGEEKIYPGNNVRDLVCNWKFPNQTSGITEYRITVYIGEHSKMNEYAWRYYTENMTINGKQEITYVGAKDKIVILPENALQKETFSIYW